MVAPAIVLNPPANLPAVTYTLEPILERGWRISGTVTHSSPPTGNYTFSLSVLPLNHEEIDDEDEAHRDPASGTIPFNEAPTFAALVARIQEEVDAMFDNIPQDAAP